MAVVLYKSNIALSIVFPCTGAYHVGDVTEELPFAMRNCVCQTETSCESHNHCFVNEVCFA